MTFFLNWLQASESTQLTVGHFTRDFLQSPVSADLTDPWGSPHDKNSSTASRDLGSTPPSYSAQLSEGFSSQPTAAVGFPVSSSPVLSAQITQDSGWLFLPQPPSPGDGASSAAAVCGLQRLPYLPLQPLLWQEASPEFSITGNFLWGSTQKANKEFLGTKEEGTCTQLWGKHQMLKQQRRGHRVTAQTLWGAPSYLRGSEIPRWHHCGQVWLTRLKFKCHSQVLFDFSKESTALMSHWAQTTTQAPFLGLFLWQRGQGLVQAHNCATDEVVTAV